MKFHICKVILWLKNGKIRKIKFLPNKVNVITGESGTGKTEILDIIDYCLFTSSSKISEDVVNENIDWYGLQVKINDKKYTVARKSLSQGLVSKDYFFSSSGEIPEDVSKNTSESTIKSLFETEFSIDSKVSIPYGSNRIKMGSKISFRYFLMFNTISVNIIENDSGVFFDKQDDARYRDALPRVFDLAIGIETIENILKKEKKTELENKLAKLERKQKTLSSKASEFQSEQAAMIKRAKEFSLIDEGLDLDSSLIELESIISGIPSNIKSTIDGEKIEREIYLLERKLHNLDRFSREHESYKRNLTSTLDSLKPIAALEERDSELIKTSIFDELVKAFHVQLLEIRKARKTSTPIDRQLRDEIRSIELKLSTLRNTITSQPKFNRNFENNREKYFFLGETKSKMDLYSSTNTVSVLSHEDNMEELVSQIESIDIMDNSAKKELTIKLIEEVIAEFIESSGTALNNYSNYLPVFNYNEKKLLLRKRKTSFIENVGSSSNHVFLHLFFSLAMHEAAFQNESPFVAPFLIIDQPSRPYWGSDNENKKNVDQSDESKICEAFKLLNSFVGSRKENKSSFQMILFEHVPKRLFTDFEHFNLVEEFEDGNALIPANLM